MKNINIKNILISLAIIFISSNITASPNLEALTLTNNANGTQTYSVTFQVLAMMTLISFVPAVIMMMTSFTRIFIVLAILRQAIGLPQAPTNKIIIGIAIFLSIFIMMPVINQINEKALTPFLDEKIEFTEALDKAKEPLSNFMLNQVRTNDLALFQKLSGTEKITNPKDLSLSVIIPAFVTSELKTSFQIGFILYIPFLIIDLVIASVLMAMGMMMLSPVIISLPFKIMLFVLVDGWTLVIGTLANSFGI